MLKIHTAMVAVLALAACTHPADVSRPLTEAGDKNAHFTVKDAPGGFTVEARYSRYQFVPETSALITTAASSLPRAPTTRPR